MKGKTQKAYFNDEWEQMKAYLDAFFQSGDQEKLHRFRVQVKKLKAMLMLLDAATPESKLLKGFKPVKKIFKQSGHIREAYINLQLANRYYLDNEDFITEQVNAMEKSILDFCAHSKKYTKTIKEVHDKLEGDLRSADNEEISEFYKRNLDEIAFTLSKLNFNDQLHNCRKQIKTLVYNRKIAQKALDGRLNLNNDYLDQLQDRIGDWHDNVLAMELFSMPGTIEKPIITRIKRQNTRLRKSISILASNFEERATFSDDEKGRSGV